MKYFVGDITKPPVPAIAHQCNCTLYGATKAKGVASEIFKAFPYADVYRIRKDHREAFTELGAVHVATPLGFPGWPASTTSPVVFNLMAQKHPGKPRSSSDDNSNRRIQSMLQCLAVVGSEIRTLGIKEIAVPYGIGCGLAGGDWNTYRRILESFEKESGCRIVVVALPKFVRTVFLESGEMYEPAGE